MYRQRKYYIRRKARAIRRKEKEILGLTKINADSEVCNNARDIYFAEFEALRNDPQYKMKMNNMTGETISSLNFSELYRTMRETAPSLFALLETLYPEQEDNPPHIHSKAYKQMVTSSSEIEPNQDDDPDVSIDPALTVDDSQNPSSRMTKTFHSAQRNTSPNVNFERFESLWPSSHLAVRPGKGST